MRRPQLSRLFLIFLRIGAFTFGGGLAMIPLIQEELVVKLRLLDDHAFVETIALAQSAPGPIAGNVAVLLGYRLNGMAGALTSLCGVAVAPVAVILLIAANYRAWRSQTWAAAAFAGLRPAIVVLVAGAALRFGRVTLRDRISWAVFATASLLLIAVNLHPVAVVAGAGLFAAVRRLPPEARPAGQGEVNRGDRDSQAD